jgi:hypothetical protein
MPMPNCIIKWVDWIGHSEKQGREYSFLNRSRGAYKWIDMVPEDDLKFQVLLEEEASFLDITA